MMSNSRIEEAPTLATDRCPKEVGWSTLSLEIRLAIWGLLYLTTPARIVEVQTAEHDHYSQPHNLWCPRYSPSPAPLVVNVCREARNEARRLAQLAGHLLFPEIHSPDIYFNPAIDNLYIPNDKNYWIRDWGPEGVLTQIKQGSKPESLRSLAICLDPRVRATTWSSLSGDLRALRGLEELVFVVKQAGEEELTWMRYLEERLRDYIWAHCRTRATMATYRDDVAKHILVPTVSGLHSFPQHCTLATMCDGQFQFVDQDLFKPRPNEHFHPSPN
jgi:hypothetical protein